MAKAWGFVVVLVCLLTFAVWQFYHGINTYLATACALLVLAFVALNLKLLFQRLSSHDYSFSALFLFFNQKMWMTAGIALFFGSLYLLFMLFHSKVFTSTMLLAVFHYTLEHPLLALLGGCAFFVFNAFLILLVRRVIRSVYNLRD